MCPKSVYAVPTDVNTPSDDTGSTMDIARRLAIQSNIEYTWATFCS